MKKVRHYKRIYVIAAIIAIVIIALMIKGVTSQDDQTLVTTTVDTGSVQQLVSVSGIAEAEQLAELGFPINGIVRTVAVKVGDVVEEGDIIAELDTNALSAERQDALSAITVAIANRDELVAGPQDSTRTVTAQTVTNAATALEQTKVTEAQKVANAYTALLSSGLAAYSDDVNEDATPPLVSGTYTCETEGSYYLDIFASGAQSGYSYRLTGLESGTYSASSDQPAAMGTCGLELLFNATDTYSNSEWIIDIPNTKSGTYVTNRNAYTLAQTQADRAITQAERDLTLAEATAEDKNSPARAEAIQRANAAIAQAQARLERIDATIADRILRAPFAGTITELDIVPGETVTTAPVATLLASGAFEVTARIPEIDIGKLLVGQSVTMVFDARSTETLTGEISFISLKETEIDGVAYYEAIIAFDEVPDWIRSGLNADIDITITELRDTTRIPSRFITTDSEGNQTVQVLDHAANTVSTSTITVIVAGNDGYSAVRDIEPGTTVVAP